MKKRILVVEDEPSILDNILYSLETEGFDPNGCPTGEDALEMLDDSTYDLMILDVGLPDINGFDVCRTVRERNNIPIIFLTARSDEIDRIVGLEIGADDYIVKPFLPRELSARVRAVLRRSEPAVPLGEAGPDPARGRQAIPFRIDPDRLQISFFGESLPLSSTEFRLLRALCNHPGRVYSRAQLMDLAWDEPEAAMERTVDAHIKSLRAKLKAVRPDHDPIVTHRGLGYSLKEDW
ncbi:MAG: two-component system response regulator CreB [Akkermansiaceae bacterium]|nr:two-component system response regulator CreB [Akkermansiaceae bacterium]